MHAFEFGISFVVELQSWNRMEDITTWMTMTRVIGYAMGVENRVGATKSVSNLLQ